MPAQPYLEQCSEGTSRLVPPVLLPTEGNTVADEIQTLAQQLLQRVLAQPLSVSHHTPENDIVLDVELDGFRCVLLRLPVPLAQSAVESSGTLSPRELEIARMIAKGYPNKTIAAILEISAWTVCTHIRRIFAKLGVGSRAAMVARLGEDGLLPLTTGVIGLPAPPFAHATTNHVPLPNHEASKRGLI